MKCYESSFSSRSTLDMVCAKGQARCWVLLLLNELCLEAMEQNIIHILLWAALGCEFLDHIIGESLAHGFKFKQFFRNIWDDWLIDSYFFRRVENTNQIKWGTLKSFHSFGTPSRGANNLGVNIWIAPSTRRKPMSDHAVDLNSVARCGQAMPPKYNIISATFLLMAMRVLGRHVEP